MICISIKQPFAFLILNNKKPIENRTWRLPEKYKGKRVLIHASGKPWTWKQFCNYIENFDSEDMELQKILRENNFSEKWLKSLPTSAIIGSVEFPDCVINHPSVWAEKTDIPSMGEVLDDIKLLGRPIPPKPIIYNWVCESPVLFDNPILDVKGKLNFWESDIEICHICGKPITKEYLCNYCDEYYCDDCSAKYDQFSQIDCNCCKKCAEKKHE
jgi:hypothetical protein